MNFQITSLESGSAKPGWRTGLAWLGAFISFPIGGLAAQAVVGSVDHVADGFIGGAAAGMVIGLGQWLVLRQTHQLKAWWIAATSLGMAIGLGLGIALVGTGTNLGEIVSRALITGGFIGLAQSSILKSGLSISILWAAVVTGSFTLAWIISSGVITNALSNNYAIFGSSGAVVFQLITGLILLRFVSIVPAKAVEVGPAPLAE